MNAVQTYIAERPAAQGHLMGALRHMVLALGPLVEEKISYGIPYYKYYGALCYLSPKKEGMYVGFVRGCELSDDQHLLEDKGQKYVRSITLYSMKELAGVTEKITHIIQEAALLNERRYYDKQQRG